MQAVGIRDPSLSLKEKWLRHVQHKRHTGITERGQTYNTMGPIFFFFSITVGSVWAFVEILPMLYANDQEGWLLPMRLLLTVMALEVAVNWAGIRWVDSQYLPAIHGTKPADFPITHEKQLSIAPETSTAADAVRLPFKGLGGSRMDGSKFVYCEKRLTQMEDCTTSNRGAGAQGSDTHAVDVDYSSPVSSRSYDGYSYRMLVATGLPTKDGQIERKAFPYWSWVPCLMCQRLRPPRCHHCTLCKQCVLKRDHHCYLTGRCIGLNNTRFFLVFLFWALLLTSFGSYHIVRFLYSHMMSHYHLHVLDLIFPVPLLRGVTGYVSLVVTPLVLVMLSIFLCNIFSFTMLLGALHLFIKGITSFERDNGIKVTDMCSLGGKLRSVFGHYWWLNILLPTYPWCTPLEDAVLWPHIKPW